MWSKYVVNNKVLGKRSYRIKILMLVKNRSCSSDPWQTLAGLMILCPASSKSTMPDCSSWIQESRSVAGGWSCPSASWRLLNHYWKSSDSIETKGFQAWAGLNKMSSLCDVLGFLTSTTASTTTVSWSSRSSKLKPRPGFSWKIFPVWSGKDSPDVSPNIKTQFRMGGHIYIHMFVNILIKIYCLYKKI